MHAYLIQYICKIGIFVICAQVLIHFRPNGSYEKYLKMLMSAMILLQMFLPISNLFTGDGEKSLAARVAWFQSQMEQSMDQVMEDHAAGERILEQMTLQEVQSRITAMEIQETDAAGLPAETKPESSAGGAGQKDGTDIEIGIGIDRIPPIKIETQNGEEGGAEDDG